MPSCMSFASADKVRDTTWDGGFEQILRRYLPFLPSDQALTSQSGLRDLGLDSFGTVELLADLESAYRVRFRDEALSLATFATPGVLWTTLSALL
ncbi:acyl carrier protein [Actinocrispum sp. NPDC049592]|uniref:acyl carrier protein n=1 Tax=Actinocrispum sp. NPDC049592 TaxID=3154835 RepID=UPI0034310F2D